MDEFDFDNDIRLSHRSSTSSASPPPLLHPPATSNRHRPPRGRTAARRSRKLLRTGADALQQATQDTAKPSDDIFADDIRKKRAATSSTHDTLHPDSLAHRPSKRRRERNGHRSSSWEDCDIPDEDASPCDVRRPALEDSSPDPYGEWQDSPRDEEDDSCCEGEGIKATSETLEDSSPEGNSPCDGNISSPFQSLKTAKDTLEDSSPEGNRPYDGNIPSPFQSSQSSNRSVRFSLSSNTRHFYLHGQYGTPPGSPREIYSKSPCLDEEHPSDNAINGICIPSSSSSNRYSTPPNCKSEEPNGPTPESKRENSDSEEITQQSTKTIHQNNPAKENETTSQSTRSSQTGTLKRQRPRSCLKATTYLSQNTASTSSHSSPSSRFSSSSSSSSHGSSTTFRKRHISRTNGSFSALAQESSHSPDETPLVTLGRLRDVSDVQDVGHYRLLVDDLSYLCSAILHSRRPWGGKHTAVTAGAACDLAEVVSQSEVQVALLMLGGAAPLQSGSKGGFVGALSAVLEALACAPPVMGVMDVCREVIEGGEERWQRGSEGGEEECVSGDCHGKHVDRPMLGRTKSARRKLDVIEINGESDSADFVRRKSLEVRDKHDAISSKALSIVAHFVSVICTRAPATTSNITKATIKAARNGVLHHKEALQGLARLVADDPVVDAYLRRKACAVHGAQSTTKNDGMIADATTETNVDDGSMTSCCTSSSRSSDFSSVSSTKSAVESNTLDPTKFGRRKSRRQKLSRLKRSLASSYSTPTLLPISEVDHDTGESLGFVKRTVDKTNDIDDAWKNCDESKDRGCVESSQKSDCLDFLSNDGSIASRSRTVLLGRSGKVELKCGVKYREKIALALSRAHLRPTIAQAILASDMNALDYDDDWICAFCSKWEQHMLVGSDTEYPSYSTVSAASVTLDAVDLIIRGKDKAIPSTDDDEHSEDEDDADDFLKTSEPDEDQVSQNPILLTNEMMRKSGTLPDYSRSMASTLASLLLSLNGQVQPKTCNKCITYLQHRASMLSGIIDNLCCLSPEASKAVSCPESLLIPSLLRVASEIHFNQETQSACIEESALTSLKTLTTLTHENSTACHQIISYRKWHPKLCVCPCSNSKLDSLPFLANGVEIIFGILFKTVTEMSNDKSGYDTIIFCLNILTNIAEAIPTSTREIFLGLIINGEVKGISWLTKWVVSKTSGFQSAVMKGSFGSTHHDDPSSENNDSELKCGEEGNLVTSGNGFVLLSYLMLDDNNGTTTSRVRDIIIEELPIDEIGNSGGIQFMIKTLKAFCNFYHYSVGDLSVAVIAPVIRLITGLEKIHVMEMSKKWL